MVLISIVRNILSFMQNFIRNSIKRTDLYSTHRTGDRYHNMDQCILFNMVTNGPLQGRGTTYGQVALHATIYKWVANMVGK